VVGQERQQVFQGGEMMTKREESKERQRNIWLMYSYIGHSARMLAEVFMPFYRAMSTRRVLELTTEMMEEYRNRWERD
jgi:hypothetical protein